MKGTCCNLKKKVIELCVRFAFRHSVVLHLLLRVELSKHFQRLELRFLVELTEDHGGGLVDLGVHCCVCSGHILAKKNLTIFLRKIQQKIDGV